jgi:hypothetical protein
MGVGPGMMGTKEGWLMLLAIILLVGGVISIGLWEGCKFVARHVDVKIVKEETPDE